MRMGQCGYGRKNNKTKPEHRGPRMRPHRHSGFLSQLVANVKQEMKRSKEMRQNIEKFRSETQKLEHSAALKIARKKIRSTGSAAARGGGFLKQQIDRVRSKVVDVVAYVVGSEWTRTVTKSGTVRAIVAAARVLQQEFDGRTLTSRVYRRPEKLRKRLDPATNIAARVVQVNTEVTSLELHKDSKFYESWTNFKRHNPLVSKLLGWKIQYMEESDNVLGSASRRLTEAVKNLFTRSELSETLTELCQIDPSFNVAEFLFLCEDDIIPNILESIVRGDLETLQDWCFEGTFRQLAAPIIQAQQAGHVFCSQILDIDRVELAMGRMAEQGPVLIVTFQAQQVMCMRDVHNEVIEGDPEQVLRYSHAWVLCRDVDEMNPASAWRLMELSARATEQVL